MWVENPSSGSSHNQHYRWIQSQPPSDTTAFLPLVRNAQLSPNLRITKIKNNCCFKLLSLRVIYYLAEVNRTLSSQSFFWYPLLGRISYPCVGHQDYPSLTTSSTKHSAQLLWTMVSLTPPNSCIKALAPSATLFGHLDSGSLSTQLRLYEPHKWALSNRTGVHLRGRESWVPVAHACNPSYSGGKYQKHHGSKPAQANSLGEPILKNPTLGGEAQKTEHLPSQE
jgi:hypothetical protein